MRSSGLSWVKTNDGIYFSTNTSLLYLSTNCLYFVLLRSIFFSDNFLLLLPTFKTKISYFVVNTFLKRASYFLRYIYIIFFQYLCVNHVISIWLISLAASKFSKRACHRWWVETIGGSRLVTATSTTLCDCDTPSH